jgi:hypothetical protein
MPPPRQPASALAPTQPPRPTTQVAAQPLSPVAGVQRAPARPIPANAAPAAPGAAPAAGEAPRPAATRCRIGMSAAPLLVDGALVTGNIQGMLRIFDAATGDILFEYMTNRPYDTVNHVDGHGGGLDSAPYIAGNGTLFVQSGYARFGEPPGNVLLAFRPKKGK